MKKGIQCNPGTVSAAVKDAYESSKCHFRLTEGRRRVLVLSQNTCQMNSYGDFRLKSKKWCLTVLSFLISSIFLFIYSIRKMMKIIYLLGLTVGMTFMGFAQQDTVTFESFILNPNSHNNGDDQSGGFTESGAHFSNYYDTTFNYFTGFAISNETDITNPGAGNQYSSYAVGGDSSSNFAVYYPAGVIDLGPGINYITSMRVTNTTYTALSMKFGDAYAKKFGDSTNSQGTVDGTNGEDFYKLRIISLSSNNDTVGYTEVYLADYRFADSTQDFILDEWTTVNLIGLNAAVLNPRYVHFELTSSDTSAWGMNTPAYFAMDNFVFEHFVVGIEELESEVKLYPNPVTDILTIENTKGVVTIMDAAGKVLNQQFSKGFTSIDFSGYPKGAYFVNISNGNVTKTHKILK